MTAPDETAPEPSVLVSSDSSLPPLVVPPEPEFVVVPRDEVEEYASRGWRVGYAMLRPE